jgi:flagellar hook-length control protein FliK
VAPVAAVTAEGEPPVAATAGTPAEGVPPNGEAAFATPTAVPEADAASPERSSTDAPAGPAGEFFAPSTGTGTGTGAGSAGARDGRTTPAEELSELPGAPAPESAGTPAPLPGAGRAPDGVPFGLQRSIPLERAPRAVAQLLHVASQSGVSHARIALRPVELGGIEIFLQVSPAGLAAQVIADSPEAARMLSQATEDLRRSLAGQNVELISIDVSTSAEQQRRDDLASSGFLADDRTPDGRLAPRRADGGPAPTTPAPEPTTPTVIELPDGLLVDVLA